MERGERNITILTVLELATALEVKPRKLLDFESWFFWFRFCRVCFPCEGFLHWKGEFYFFLIALQPLTCSRKNRRWIIRIKWGSVLTVTVYMTSICNYGSGAGAPVNCIVKLNNQHKSAESRIHIYYWWRVNEPFGLFALLSLYFIISRELSLFLSWCDWGGEAL